MDGLATQINVPIAVRKFILTGSKASNTKFNKNSLNMKEMWKKIWIGFVIIAIIPMMAILCLYVIDVKQMLATFLVILHCTELSLLETGIAISVAE